MAIQKSLILAFSAVGDGTNTVFELDLDRDPYLILCGILGVTTPLTLVNWFSNDRVNKPVSVVGGQTTGDDHINFSVTLTYPALTVTLASAPPNGDTVNFEVQVRY